MNDNSELFRNELIVKLENELTQEQLMRVLYAFDVTSADFDIVRHPLDLITADGFPESVKWYIAAKAIANRKKKTLYNYTNKLLKFFKAVKKPYQDVNANDIRIYLYNFKKEHNASDSYLDSIRITLNSYFQWMVDNLHLLRNPVRQVEKISYCQASRVPLTTYQLEELRWNTANIREKALIDFFFSTGLRVSECADVRLSDINWKERSVHVRHGKGDKQRIVYFNSESEYSMRKYLDSINDEVDALFVSSRKPTKQIGAHALEDIISKAAKRKSLFNKHHGVRICTLHRNTVITRALSVSCSDVPGTPIKGRLYLYKRTGLHPSVSTYSTTRDFILLLLINNVLRTIHQQ